MSQSAGRTGIRIRPSTPGLYKMTWSLPGWARNPTTRHALPAGASASGVRRVAQLSPYLIAHISRFGLYATDVLRLRPDDFDPDLPEAA
ncbi:hypothetical protein [Streptosporangium sp. NPDC051022]|uniref:hypothetical protein n=1 Tax=Streptosporangium sp. NPDC051022 TaxID=3155752 RepID=UPI003437B83C